MEIQVVARMTGAAYRERILTRYGSRAALEAAARGRRAFAAQSDLADLRLLDEDPRRLAAAMEVTEITTLSESDVEALTPARLRLLHAIAESEAALNLSQLTRSLGRDKKNVSRDLAVLRRLGLVETAVQGRQTFPRVKGRELRILL